MFAKEMYSKCETVQWSFEIRIDQNHHPCMLFVHFFTRIMFICRLFISQRYVYITMPDYEFLRK